MEHFGAFSVKDQSPVGLEDRGPTAENQHYCVDRTGKPDAEDPRVRIRKCGGLTGSIKSERGPETRPAVSSPFCAGENSQGDRGTHEGDGLVTSSRGNDPFIHFKP